MNVLFIKENQIYSLFSNWQWYSKSFTSIHNFITNKNFQKLFYFEIFWYIDGLDIFIFNHTKVKTTLSSIYGIKFCSHLLLVNNDCISDFGNRKSRE